MSETICGQHGTAFVLMCPMCSKEAKSVTRDEKKVIVICLKNALCVNALGFAEGKIAKDLIARFDQKGGK